MSPTVRAIREADIVPFLAAMSGFDQAVTAEVTSDPEAMVATVLDLSAYTYHASCSAPLFMGGLLAGGNIWMIATPHVAAHRKFYLRETQRQRDVMLKREPVLQTWVDIRYPKSLRWLEWLGFTIGEPIAMGAATVRHVELRRDV